jgi:hypothetical protein
LAFGGNAALAGVDISTDNGVSWNSAQLEKDWGTYSFRMWSFTFTPKAPGKVEFLARATNRAGDQQPMIAGWNPGGFMYNGILRVAVEVV